MPKWLIHPFHPYFRMFLYLTVVMAGLTGLVTPWVIAFQEVPGLWCADPPLHSLCSTVLRVMLRVTSTVTHGQDAHWKGFRPGFGQGLKLDLR